MGSLADRMKAYEAVSDGRVTANLPVVVRIDGKAFHSWTRGCGRPFDSRLQSLFDSTTKFLVEKSGAVIGYTQSDEINLVLWNGGDPKSQIFFDGRVAKLNSVLASMTTAYFNNAQLISQKLAFFDARCFAVPSPEEAVNCLIWRERDATRNSVQMLAQDHYSHGQLHGKKTPDLHDMLHRKGVNWNDCPSRFKRGAYFKRRTVERSLTAEELEALPEKHEARKAPDNKVVRHLIEQLELPPLTRISNRVGVIFHGEEPAQDGDD